MSIGAKLNRLRLEKGESLQQVAESVGLSKTHLWELEKGKSANPSLELLKKLAEHFKASVEFLVESDRDQMTLNEEALVFYRDLKQLAPEDQELIRQTVDRLMKK